MDRDQLVAALPTNAQFNASFPYQRKETAERFIGSILDAIAAEGREPDDWEAHDIAAAIGFSAAGMYNAALSYADRALTPPDKRSPIQPKDAKDPPAARQLRDALAYVGGMPARAY